MTETPFFDRRPQRWSNRRILILVALAALIVSLMWRLPEGFEYVAHRTGEILFTFVLAMSLTYLMRPPVQALERLRLFGGGHSHSGRMWATAIIFAISIALLGVAVVMGMRPLINGWNSFFAQDTAGRLLTVDQWTSAVEAFVKRYEGVLPDSIVSDIKQDIPAMIIALKQQVGGWMSRSFSHLGFIVELLLVPVLVFYFLTDGPAIRAEARLLAPDLWRPAGRRVMAYLDRVFDGYIRGQVIMCLIAWLLVTLALLALGVPYAFTLGVIAGVTRAVPIIGPLLGAIPLILVCFIATRSIETTLLLLAGFTAMHFLESKVLLPKIIGHEVDLHPVSVILALLLGMEFFGFLGVFLAVPLAAVAKILLAEYHQRAAHDFTESRSQAANEQLETAESTS